MSRIVARCSSAAACWLERIEDWNRARRWHVRAVRLEPDRAAAWVGVGRTSERGGPTGPVVDPRAGVVEGWVGDPVLAAEAYERALAVDPSCAAAWAGILRAHRRATALGLADPARSIERGSIAVASVPTDPDVWFERAWSVVVAGRAAGGLTAGDVDDAIEAFERCLVLAPHHARARFHLVRTAVQFARWETAAGAAWPSERSRDLDLGADDVERVAITEAPPRDWLLVHGWRLHAGGAYRESERVRTVAAARAADRSGRPLESVTDVVEAVQGAIRLGDLDRAAETLRADVRRRHPADALAIGKLGADLALRRGDVGALERWAGRHAVAADPLAERRFADLVRGRRVAVVGPVGASTETGSLGAEIDGHDVVIRTKGVAGLDLDASHGTRTDIAFYSDSSATLLTPQIRSSLAEGRVALAVVRPSWLDVWRAAGFDEGTVRVTPFEDLATFQASHFAILRIVYDLLRYRPEAITVYHTNFFTTATLYASAYAFDQPFYDERSFARVVPMYGHDLAADFRFAGELRRTGLVGGDPVVERLMALSTDDYLAQVELATAARNGGPR